MLEGISALFFIARSGVDHLIPPCCNHRAGLCGCYPRGPHDAGDSFQPGRGWWLALMSPSRVLKLATWATSHTAVPSEFSTQAAVTFTACHICLFFSVSKTRESKKSPPPFS